MKHQRWQLQEAKNRLSRLIDNAVKDGPQTITRHGRPIVVVISIDDYQKESAHEGALVDFLINSPLHDSGLTLERDQDTGRDLDL